ncbi:MAG: SMC-Scp complex subunit ScpB [Candidatus Aenigmatarchaeota archaeon]
MNEQKLKSVVEAALYMANEPISVKEMAKMFNVEPDSVKVVIDEFKKELESSEHGIYILETPRGYQIRVKPKLDPLVRKLTPYKDLSRGLLRVLALVAYKQPITQSEIVKVIGNRTYEYVKALKERGLVNTVKQGRTKALVPTKEFANYFGLEKPEDIKKFFEEYKEETVKETDESDVKSSEEMGA